MPISKPQKQFDEHGYCALTLTAEDFALHRQPSKFTILVLCTEGNAVVEFNMEKFMLQPSSCLCYSHVMQVLSVDVSPDFRALALVMNENFAFESVVGIDSETLYALFTAPVTQIEDDANWQMLLNLYQALNIYGTANVGQFHPEVARSLFRTLLIVLGELHSRSHHSHTGRPVYTMAENYFRNFVNLLNEHVQQEHEVAFYAKQLNITSKYLNEICKQKSGRKAKELISSILSTFIRRELMYSSKSMKEIAAKYRFADQSSLGKFFRKQTGQSPLFYRHHQSQLD